MPPALGSVMVLTVASRVIGRLPSVTMATLERKSQGFLTRLP